MAVLLIVVLVIIGLAWRAGLYTGRARVAEAEDDVSTDSGFFDVCARTFVLVFLCLLGLLALGVMYGNVLGGVHASP